MKCIVFDVNETLLDLDTMQPIFERIFKDPIAVRLWFQTLILYSEALTLARVYVPFTDIGTAELEMFAKTRGVTVSTDDKSELTIGSRRCPRIRRFPRPLGYCAARDFASSRLRTTCSRSRHGNSSTLGS